MDYFYKIKDTVSQVAAQASKVLPGNPITREYEVKELLATAGPGLLWKIHCGYKRSTKQKCAVWFFEKNDIEKWPKEDKEQFLNIIRKNVLTLTRIRHNRILIVEHGIEESRESIAFCTEPIFASLENIFKPTNAPYNPDLKDYELEDLEIKHGLFQIGEALTFLHIDLKMVHRNICPESIIINERGAWKLGCFEFSCNEVLNSQNIGNTISFPCLNWDQQKMSATQANLNFIAPEHINQKECYPSSDMFSLGVLSYACFNQGKPIFEHKNNLNTFKNNSRKLEDITTTQVAKIPAEFQNDVKKCCALNPVFRPDCAQFTRLVYFDTIQIKTLNYLENLMQMDHNQKIVFFKGLLQVFNKFPKRTLFQKVLPFLSSEFSTHQLIPFILPSIFQMAEMSNNIEFSRYILPSLIPVFSIQRPYQISLLLLQKMELLLKKTPESDIKKHVLPLLYNSLLSETDRIQELCLTNIPTIGKLVDRDIMKNQLLPRILKLVTDGNIISIKIQALLCLAKLMPNLEHWMVSDQIIPVLSKVTCKEPGVLMAILGVYKLAFESEKFGISRELIARNTLPFLISTSIENTLNLSQFESFMLLIKQMLSKMESEQRSRLQQLSAGQEEQRAVADFNELINQKTSTVTNTDKAVKDLDDFFKNTNTKTPEVSKPTTIDNIFEPKSKTLDTSSTKSEPNNDLFDFTEFLKPKPTAPVVQTNSPFNNISFPSPPSVVNSISSTNSPLNFDKPFSNNVEKHNTFLTQQTSIPSMSNTFANNGFFNNQEPTIPVSKPVAKGNDPFADLDPFAKTRGPPMNSLSTNKSTSKTNNLFDNCQKSANNQLNDIFG
ncbi:Novel protein [Strongyloides ratti]|uniref:Novel protein n=1 Tax=Strongyloides ratti TaxID=34506 RepID=A0A090L098_STRRB|nr:Novel protein [Strongyloides ratti]CEF63111.1 Novel protein [Strongyloides ratti]